MFLFYPPPTLDAAVAAPTGALGSFGTNFGRWRGRHCGVRTTHTSHTLEAERMPKPSAPRASKSVPKDVGNMQNAAMQQIVKEVNNVIKEQNAAIKKYVTAMHINQQARYAAFENHINHLQDMVETLTEDTTSTLGGKRLVDHEKRATCMQKVRAYRKSYLANEAKLSAEEKVWELKPMPLLNIGDPCGVEQVADSGDDDSDGSLEDELVDAVEAVSDKAKGKQRVE